MAQSESVLEHLHLKSVSKKVLAFFQLILELNQNFSNLEVKGIAEYLDIKVDRGLLLSLYKKVGTHNTFGKTPFVSYSLENSMTGKPTGYEKMFDPLLSQHRKVHPHYQFRSTGFNTADSTEKDVFPHTDIDEDTEHPTGYNIVIPVFGNSRIDYYETKDEEVYYLKRMLTVMHTITNLKHKKKWVKVHQSLKSF